MTDDCMPGDEATATDIVRAVSREAQVAHMLPTLSDDEIRRTYRIAKSLAASGMFKDTSQAERAFAKILIGRDLGLGPTQAMMGIDLVEGGIQLRAVLLARFIKATGRYTFLVRRGDEPSPVWPPAGERSGVYHHDDDHCLIDFYERTGGGFIWVGESQFTMADAHSAGLVKADKPRQAWKAHPRNMLWARALSNGAKWHCSDALGGLIVYTEGDSFERRETIGTDGEPAGIDLGPKVEALMERARRVGHAGLADRGNLELRLGDQPPEYVDQYVSEANKELDRIEAEHGESVDGEAVEEPEGAKA
jgi:hypothetical protein